MRCNPIREPGRGYGLVAACGAAGLALALAAPALAAAGPGARAAGGKGRGAPAGRLLAEALRADYLAATLGGVVPCNGSTRLYRPGAYSGLTVVDKIVPAPESAASIDTGVSRVYRDGDGDLYVLWPAVLAKFITVLRPGHPADPSTYPYALGVQGGGFFDAGSAIAGSSAYGGSLLYAPWSYGRRMALVFAFLAHPAPGEAPVRRARWSDFLDLRVGGPSSGVCGWNETLGAQVNGPSVTLPPVAGPGRSEQLAIAPAPASLPASQRGVGRCWGRGVNVLGADARWLVYSLAPRASPPRPNTLTYFSKGGKVTVTCPDVGSGQHAPGPVKAYVYDRTRRKLRALMLPTNRSQPEVRLFGDWLATVVEVGAPHNTYHPGAANEREIGSLALPETRSNYEGWATYFYLPGELESDNLADGRKLAIRTGQEDTEILDVRPDGLVLYRVDNQIFAARIRGDHMGPRVLVAADVDVPEVHWVLWTRPPAQREAPDRRGRPSHFLRAERSSRVAVPGRPAKPPSSAAAKTRTGEDAHPTISAPAPSANNAGPPPC